MFTILEYAGALGLLMAFGLSQAGRWPTGSYRYQALNTVAALALVAAGFASGQFGFVVINVAWAAVSAHALLTHPHAGGSRGAPGDGR